MTNWAVTRPDNKFAFGISNYGIADLMLQSLKSVVGSYFVSELGDRVQRADFYKNRSPINWMDSMKIPVLFTHGSRDFRVVPEDIRNFHSKLKAAGKPVEYVELDGEGHGYAYMDTLQVFYQNALNFLWKVAPVNVEK